MYVDSVKNLSSRGIYTLTILLLKNTSLKIGKLGTHNFPKGYYTYTGSALSPAPSSLSSRVSRHLRKKKNKHWHIDYILSDPNSTIKAVVAVATSQRLECKLNQAVKDSVDGKILVNGFGASDCKENCGSHLLYYPDMSKNQDLVQKVVKCAHLLGDKVFVLRF